MDQPQLRLYVDAQFMSPYAMSVFVALHEKALPHDLIGVDLTTQANRQADYQRRSLTGRVPALEHGKFSLSESSAITEYLEEVFPPPAYAALYPQQPDQRARARQVQAWLRSDLLPLRDERPTAVIFQQPSDTPLSDSARFAAEQLFEAATALLKDHHLSLLGQWCIADTDLALMINRLVANGDEVPDRLVEYVQHQWQRPSVRAWIEQGLAVAGSLRM
ncbi:glutathione transferase [Nodosilinea sp. AN01ver1]|uniref:glutathione transferase n=1 Tax=Nodosilinea sp. AN01ver1 TaxID=3423362 RepID=UPI003D31E01E